MKRPCRNASQTSIIKMRELPAYRTGRHPIPLKTFNFNGMKTNRRDFIKSAALASTGIATGAMASCDGNQDNNSKSTAPHEISHKEYKQKFNMSGYAAPKLNVVRVGYIGIGGRGLGSVRRMRLIEGVEIRALCDIL